MLTKVRSAAAMVLFLETDLIIRNFVIRNFMRIKMKNKNLYNKEKNTKSTDSSEGKLEEEIQRQIEQNREINKALEKLLKSVNDDLDLKDE